MKRLNWIDYLVIVILIGALAFVGLKVLGDKEQSAGSAEENLLSQPNLTMIVEIADLSREIAENAVASFAGQPRELDGVSVPMTRLFNSNRLVDGQIVSWEIRETEGEETVALRLTIDANGTLFRGSYTVGTQEVRIGKTFIAKTMSMELDGVVVSLTELGE